MITVIGSINLDLIATVDRLPAPGETVLGDGFRTAPGGKGANQALAAARAGGQRAHGRRGRQATPSRPRRRPCSARAASILSAVRDSGEPTGVALILVGGSGENVIAVVPGANGTVGRDAVAAAGIAAGEHVVLQHEIPLDAVEAAWTRRVGRRRLAAQHRAVSPRSRAAARQGRLCDRQRDRVRPLCRATGACTAPTARRACAPSRERTGRTIIVTLGGEGVIAVAPDGTLEVRGAEHHAGRYRRRRRHVLRLSGGRPARRACRWSRRFGGPPPPARSPA